MYIVRWLMTHPIIAIWVLGAIAILLSKSASFQGTHEIENTEVTHQIEETHKEVTHEVNNNHKVGVASVTDEVSAFETNSNEVVSINHEAASAPEEELATEAVEDTVKSSAEEVKSATVDSVANSMPDSTATESTITNKIAAVTKEVKDTTINTAKQAVESIANKSGNAVSAMTATTESKSSTDAIKEVIIQKVREAQPTATITAQNQSADIQNLATTNNDGSYLAQTSSASELLIMAREAYWNNGFDEAAELYMQLIKLEPNVMDYKGELGNVYWRQGYPKKAAELYSEIALPMIENGNSDRVANMVGFIGLFYPDRATTIHQKLMSKISGAE